MDKIDYVNKSKVKNLRPNILDNSSEFNAATVCRGKACYDAATVCRGKACYDAATVYAIIQERTNINRLILVCENKAKIPGTSISILGTPGGNIDPYDHNNPFATVTREFQEETGASIPSSATIESLVLDRRIFISSADLGAKRYKFNRYTFLPRVKKIVNAIEKARNAFRNNTKSSLLYYCDIDNKWYITISIEGKIYALRPCMTKSIIRCSVIMRFLKKYL